MKNLLVAYIETEGNLIFPNGDVDDFIKLLSAIYKAGGGSLIKKP